MTRLKLLVLLVAAFSQTGVIFASGSGSVSIIAPVIRSVGTGSQQINNCAAGVPAGIQSGDLLLLFTFTRNEDPTWDGSWTAAPNSGVGIGTGCPSGDCAEINVHYAQATGSEGSTEFTVLDNGTNVKICIGVAIEAGTWDTSSPWNGTNTNTQTATTSISATGFSTDLDNTLVFVGVGSEGPDVNNEPLLTSVANGNLTSLTTHWNVSKSSGLGGGLLVVSGALATAGATGATTATAADSLVRANWVGAVNGLPE